MTEQWPSSFVQNYPRKIAYLIDCVNGINGFSLDSKLISKFPLNSDIFLFYHDDNPGMVRRLKRIESNNHGVYSFATKFGGIDAIMTFILGQICNKYDSFIFIAYPQPFYQNLCEMLIAKNEKLRNHIQVRLFERVSEFEQNLKEMAQLQEKNIEESKTHKKTVVHYSRRHLFHPCPFESAEESSILYRFGELLHHFDNEHSEIDYKYCNQCMDMLNEKDKTDPVDIEEHIKEKHWKENGFEIIIRL